MVRKDDNQNREDDLLEIDLIDQYLRKKHGMMIQLI